MRMLPLLVTTALAASALSGCAEQPMGPMVQVLPKPGKPYATFVSEQNFCEQQAGGAVAGQASSANQRAVVGGLLVHRLWRRGRLLDPEPIPARVRV